MGGYLRRLDLSSVWRLCRVRPILAVHRAGRGVGSSRRVIQAHTSASVPRSRRQARRSITLIVARQPQGPNGGGAASRGRRGFADARRRPIARMCPAQQSGAVATPMRARCAIRVKESSAPKLESCARVGRYRTTLPAHTVSAPSRARSIARGIKESNAQTLRCSPSTSRCAPSSGRWACRPHYPCRRVPATPRCSTTRSSRAATRRRFSRAVQAREPTRHHAARTRPSVHRSASSPIPALFTPPSRRSIGLRDG